jgi:hypothetical protein
MCPKIDVMERECKNYNILSASKQGQSSSERLMTILLILSSKKTTLLITGHLHFYFAIP